jgi:hypothetical protein
MEIVRALWAAKEGNTPEQYEDAFALGTLQIAVSDGASAAVYAREWANLLTECFSEEAFPEKDDAFFSRVASLGNDWARAVGVGGSQAWYAQEKVPQGSQASLLVVRIDPIKKRWTACAIGDVCVFIVAGEKLHYAFPLTKSKQFGTHPDLVPTDPAQLKKRPKVVRHSNSYPDGGRLIFCTDAIAAWFLAEHEKKAMPWLTLPSASEFPEWLQHLRDSGEMKNDDVTLLEVAL